MERYFVTSDDYEGKQNEKYIANIAWDKRVFKGSTLNRKIIPKKKNLKRKKLSKPKPKIYKEYDYAVEELSSDEEEERKNLAVDLSEFLEEKQPTIKKKDVYCQTDNFQISSNLQKTKYIPKRSGIDTSVQVEEDLFNFSKESKPLVDVIVSKTIEQSLMEVLQEEELESLKNRQKVLLQKQKNKKEEIKNMEEKELNLFLNKEKRLKENRKKDENLKFIKKKIFAIKFSAKVLKGIENKIMNKLQLNGFFYDKKKKIVEDQFLPWLRRNVESELEKKQKKTEMMINNIL